MAGLAHEQMKDRKRFIADIWKQPPDRAQENRSVRRGKDIARADEDQNGPCDQWPISPEATARGSNLPGILVRAAGLRAHFLDNHAIGLQISQVMESVPGAVATGLTIPPARFVQTATTRSHPPPVRSRYCLLSTKLTLDEGSPTLLLYRRTIYRPLIYVL